MSSHTGRAFLNSCLKVPIDPCNNCPAPIYNRPKMYLGRLTTTPMISTAKLTTCTSFKGTDDVLWANSGGVRSLAKFYDSIPDYCDINHLPEEEFYSTLDTLKTTCRQLRLDSSNNNSSSSSSMGLITETKTRSGRKKFGSAKSGGKKKSGHKKSHESKPAAELGRCFTETPCSSAVEYKKKNILERTRRKSFKEEFEDEVDSFKRILKDFEEEFKRPVSSSLCRTKMTSFSAKKKDEPKKEFRESTKENAEKVPVKHTTTTTMREFLRKSFSFNDIHNISESKDSPDVVRQNRTLTKAESLVFKDRNKMSNYFTQKPNKIGNIYNLTRKSPTNGEIPKIIVESPSSDTTSSKVSSSTSSRANTGRKKKSKSKKQEENIKPPFTLFDLSTKKENIEQSSPSPLHPVARPNLAATLRVEVSKKKLKELQNNCTYHDSTPQVDWEVRRTPAWKSLSLNESHKEILSLRLATRKAEQALQQREYELHMELMRQRVKSAPLLLEGTTFWGPDVGKLTHTCQREGTKHLCQSSQRKQRKKSTRSGGGAGSECGIGSRMTNKLNALRKIYSSSAKCYSSHNSHASTRSQQRQGKQRGEQRLEQEGGNDSGDELSSVDRAYL